MNKAALETKLTAAHQEFINYIKNLSEEEFLQMPGGKWSAGQELRHIYLSVKPFAQVLMAPKWLLKIVWGQANRESRSYDELVKKYQDKLRNGGRATGRFIPRPVPVEKRDLLAAKLQSALYDLNKKLGRFEEEELDRYILPHPLLGKLTVREMLFFTVYHVQHHQRLCREKLGK
ncbi:MAG: DinB family protein [Ferruginibacter sp.]